MGAGGRVVQPAIHSNEAVATDATRQRFVARCERVFNDKVNGMTLILLEVLGALAIAVFIVWWTMFSGRKPEAVVSPDVTPHVTPDVTPDLRPGLAPEAAPDHAAPGRHPKL